MLNGNGRRSACLLMVVVVGAAGACRRGGGEEQTTAVISEDVPIEMTLKVRGDVQVDFKGKPVGKYTMIRSSGSSGTVEVLGVRPLDALRLGQAAFVPGMSAIPYKGDGQYVVPKAVDEQPSVATAQEPKSLVTFVYWATGQLESEPLQFERHLESCVIKISKGGTVGQAKCPKMATSTGDKTISLDLRWKAPKLKAQPRVTTPSTDPSAPGSSTP